MIAQYSYVWVNILLSIYNQAKTTHRGNERKMRKKKKHVHMKADEVW